MSSGKAIIKRNYTFSESNSDFYETPIIAVEALLQKESFNPYLDLIYEPCVGEGAISSVLEDKGFLVVSSDIRDTAYCSAKGISGIDAIQSAKHPRYTFQHQKFHHVITNPPYQLAVDIVRASIGMAQCKVCTLLRMSFWESERRRAFFDEFPPARIHSFTKRLSMYPHGKALNEPRGSGTVHYAWFVWEVGYQGQTVITRI